MESFKFSYTYDLAFDLVDLSCDGEFTYKQSVKLDEGIYLDFDGDNKPVALELIGASKILGIHRRHLVEPDFKVSVKITDNLIKTEINVAYLIKRRKHNLSIKNQVSNHYSFPSIEVVLTN